MIGSVMHHDAGLGERRDDHCRQTNAVAAWVALFGAGLILRAGLSETRRREMVVEAATVVPRDDDDRIFPILAFRDGIDNLREVGLCYLMIRAAAPGMIVVTDVIFLPGRIAGKDLIGGHQTIRVLVTALYPEDARRRKLPFLDVGD